MNSMEHLKEKRKAKAIVMYSVLAFLIMQPVLSWAQKELKEANNKFDRLSYSDAIPMYKKLLEVDTSLWEAKVKLSDSYRLTGNYRDAEHWYALVVESSKASEIDRFHYGQVLMNNGKYSEARRWMKRAEEELGDDKRAKKFIKSIDTYDSFFKDTTSYSIVDLPLNTQGNDFCPSYFQQGIVYSASRVTPKKNERHTWTGQSYTRLYYADSAGLSSHEFATEIETGLNNGPASFNTEGTEMFVTLNYTDIKNATNMLQIVSSKYKRGRWRKKRNFPYNDKKFTLAHPALDHRGTQIYFSSNMPGGEGGMDLYVCTRENETWSKPRNLGRSINTPGNEVFPFMHRDGTLYFSSNGHEGLGGLDIYSTSLQDSTWSMPVNVGYPINSRLDDFGLIVNESRRSGYFSSNRARGKGGDDIYKFEFTPQILNGIVLSDNTKMPVSGATVVLQDVASSDTLKTFVIGETGGFRFSVSPCKEYKVVITHPEYPGNKIETFKSSCNTGATDSLKIILAKPYLSAVLINKYTNIPIKVANLKVYAQEDSALLYSATVADFKFLMTPCKKYKIVAATDGMPTSTELYQAECHLKNEVITLSMGLPPVDPTFISGTVVEQGTKHPLDSTMAIAFDKNNTPLTQLVTNEQGRFFVAGFKNVQQLNFFRKGYFSVVKNLQLESNKKEIVVEMPRLELDKIIKLEGVFYDLGKFNIRPTAAAVLDNLVKVMQENPTLEIELSAHTDSRGSDESNLSLSDKRAKAAAAYIIGKGIAESRIAGKGYGESRLKNKCGNGIKCSDTMHQENRRTEVRIVKY